MIAPTVIVKPRIDLGVDPPDGWRENVAYRHRLKALMTVDAGFRAQVWRRCARDLCFFVNALGVTYQAKPWPMVLPMILFPLQTRYMRLLQRDGGRRHFHVDKSRDMGLTWCSLFYLFWLWLFIPRGKFHLASWKGELVDQRGHPGFKRFAQPRPAMPEVDVLDRLLADRRGPAGRPVLDRGTNRLHVKTPVVAKIRILRRHGGAGHHGGDLFQRHPVPLHPAQTARFREHVETRGWIDEAEQQHQQHRQEKGQRQGAQGPTARAFLERGAALARFLTLGGGLFPCRHGSAIGRLRDFVNGSRAR